MKVPALIPPGIEAAAWRFAKASQRDGHGTATSYMLARDGVPRIIEYYDNNGVQHFCDYEERLKQWYERFEDGDSNAE